MIKKISLSLLILSAFLFGQNNSALRFGDYFLFQPGVNFFSVSRFMPIVSVSSLASRYSNSNQFSIDGIPFDLIPFGFNSPDLIPLDFLNSNISLNSPEVSTFTNNAFGKISFERNSIADSSEIKFRGFLGSATGDPLIFSFSRKEEELYNRNKIVPSGILSYSSKEKNLSFRLSAGYFGYFITGAENDKLISLLDNYYFKKQNKQVLLSTEALYNLGDGKSIELFSSFISYYGWDSAPFLNSFNHLEMYLNTNRITFNNFISGFNLTILRDGSIGQVNKNRFTPSLKYGMNKWSALPVYKFHISAVKFSTSANFSLISFGDIEFNKFDSNQNFFDVEANKFSFFAAEDISFPVKDWFSLNAKLSYQKNVSGEENLSGYFLAKKNFTPASIFKITASSISNSPSIEQLYGSSFTVRNIRDKEKFRIEGNPNIKSERVNSLIFEYSEKVKNLNLHARVLFEKIENNIAPEIRQTFRAAAVQDIVSNAVYNNKSGMKYYGVELSFQGLPIEKFGIRFDYSFKRGKDLDYIPENKIFTELKFEIVKNGNFIFSYFYSDATWKDFYLPEYVDAFSGSGFFPGKNERSVFNLGFDQKLKDFYLFDDLELGLSIQNIFNDEIKFLPTGNNIDRTILFFIKTLIN